MEEILTDEQRREVIQTRCFSLITQRFDLECNCLLEGEYAAFIVRSNIAGGTVFGPGNQVRPIHVVFTDYLQHFCSTQAIYLNLDVLKGTILEALEGIEAHRIETFALSYPDVRGILHYEDLQNIQPEGIDYVQTNFAALSKLYQVLTASIYDLIRELAEKQEFKHLAVLANKEV
ncbi:MAG: hypothetical protein ABIE03_06465 [Patescibacteria group bacterium]|nr:hypothetical protein [Patescibacteria group bacterium]